MGLALVLIVMGILILFDRMSVGYGLREGWPWLLIALGMGGIFRNRKSISAWVTTIIGILILGAKYYSIHIRFPNIIKDYFLPFFLIFLGFLWLLRYRDD